STFEASPLEPPPSAASVLASPRTGGPASNRADASGLEPRPASISTRRSGSEPARGAVRSSRQATDSPASATFVVERKYNIQRSAPGTWSATAPNSSHPPRTQAARKNPRKRPRHDIRRFNGGDGRSSTTPRDATHH